MKMIRVGSLSVSAGHIVKLELDAASGGLFVHLQSGDPVWVTAPEGVEAEALRDAPEAEIGGGEAIQVGDLLPSE